MHSTTYLNFLKFICTSLALITTLTISAHAEDDDEETLDFSNIVDFKTLSGMDARLAPHGNDLMGDMIDKNTGAISFQHTDISIPGNSGLEVAFRRKVSEGSFYYSPFQQGFGDWVIDLPIAHISYGIDTGNHSTPVLNGGCLNTLGSMDLQVTAAHPQHPMPVNPNSHVSGSVLSVPGKGLSGYAGDVKTPADPQSDWTSAARTTDHAGRCATQVIAPDGTKYKFGRHTFRAASQMRIPFMYASSGQYHYGIRSIAVVHRKYAVYLITEVEDVHGNWVRYDYTNNARAELTRIYSNDGREINVYYSNMVSNHPQANSRFISHITANGRRWDYEYSPQNGSGTALQRLHKVALPDGRFWQFGDSNSYGLRGIQFGPHVHFKCVPFETSFNLKHPDGATGTFQIRETRHIKNATNFGDRGVDDNEPTHFIEERSVPHYTNNDECRSTPEGWRPEGWPYYQAMSVAEKTISGPDIPTATWDFEYRDYTGGPLDNNWTTITEPDGTKRTYTHQAVGLDRGLLKSIDVVPASGAGETVTYEHSQVGGGAPGGTYGQCRADGDGLQTNAGNCQVYRKRPITKMVQQRDGDTFTTEYSYNFGSTLANYASGPVSVKKYSNVSTTPRETVSTYEHNTSKWILGLPKTITRNGQPMASYTYNNSGQKTHAYAFGALKAKYGYHTNSAYKGAVYWIEDGNANRTYALDWKRGTPQRIRRAAGTADETNAYQYVDDNGWVTSTKDPMNQTTTYSRDNMGRLTLINPPGSWTNTSISYNFAGGGAVQTITKGPRVETITYDSMFRPILEKISGSGVASIYTNTEYDALGRVKFKSQPSASATETKGTDYTYDGLGRIYDETETVAPYAKTRHRYYSSHRKLVLDPSNAGTNYYSLGYDGPNSDDYRAIYKYDGSGNKYTFLYKNIWGQVTRIHQWDNNTGYGVDKNQYFYYNSQQELCRYRTVEGGDTLYAYDNGGRLTSYSKGHPNGSSCPAPSGSTKVALGYDNLDRLKTTNYTDANTPDITRTYDKNSNVKTVNRGGVNWTYAYNNINLLTAETLAIDGKTFPMSYVYNNHGHMTRRTLPKSLMTGGTRQINYEYDALGRINDVENGTANLAYNVGYHPSGAVSGMNYGNGHVFTQILNTRLLPQRMQSYKGSTKALDLTYTYTPRGQVASITNQAVSGENRSFTYDNLGQVKTASGPWGSGSFSYDSLGNIRSKTLGDRTVSMTYDSKNRLTKYKDITPPPYCKYGASCPGTSVSKTLGYDARGNVTTLGNTAFIYDMADQPRAVSGGTYKYDGNLKRVKAYVNVQTIYNVYDASGALVHVETVGGDAVSYVKGPMGTLARITPNNTVTYMHADHLGSTTTMTNGTATAGTGVRAGTTKFETGQAMAVTDDASGRVITADPLEGRR